MAWVNNFHQQCYCVAVKELNPQKFEERLFEIIREKRGKNGENYSGVGIWQQQGSIGNNVGLALAVIPPPPSYSPPPPNHPFTQNTTETFC